MRRLLPLLALLGACEKQQETITTTLPSEPAPPHAAERTVERPIDPKSLLTAEIAREAGFGNAVTVRCAESTARTASFEIVDARVRGMLFAYLHDDESHARERFQATAATRGGSGVSYTFADGDTAEAGRLSGRLTLTVRLSGADATKLAQALLSRITP